ncbi:MAG: hypothetical protein UDA86_08200 [Blautia sp.]|nr:hypothetical protein [Blautia sp.]
MNIQGDQILELIKGLWSFVPKEYMILIYLVGTVFAFLNCFMGYRLRKVWGCILGIFMGGGVGFGAGLYFLQDKMMAGLAAAAGALIFGLLAWLLYKFGVFVMCTALVYSIVVSFFQDAGLTQHFIALIIGLFAGTFALGYEKQMVIGITALCGGLGGIHLMMEMLEKDAGAGELLLGLIMAAIGVAVQAAPFMKGKDWEAKLFRLPNGRKKKKVVKKTKVKEVSHSTKGKNSNNNNYKKTTGTKQKYQQDVFDEEDYDEEDLPVTRQEDFDKTQEYEIGKKQYDKQNQMPYMGPGIGIDLDDLNRELSQEIKKIYKDDGQ